MTVDRVGPIDPVSQPGKAEKNAKVRNDGTGDSISVSSEARNQADLYSVTETARMAPDVRPDRVEEVKRKLEDPSYINDKVISDVADKLMEMFEI